MNASLRNVVGSSIILIASLAAAWSEWTDTDVSAEDGVVAVEGQLENLSKVIWRTEKEELVLEQKQDEHGTYWWVTQTTTRMVPVKDAKETEPEPEPEPEPETLPENTEEESAMLARLDELEIIHLIVSPRLVSESLSRIGLPKSKYRKIFRNGCFQLK